MIKTKVEETIAKPAEEIWNVAADIERHPRWMSVTTAERLVGTGAHIGDRGRERMKLGPFTYDAEFTVVEAQPGRRITWRAGAGAPFTGDLVLELELLGPSSTRATYSGSFTLRGLLRLLEPLMGAEASKGPAAELRRLKDLVESGSDRQG